MKNLINSTLVLSIIALVISSCGDKNPITPTPEPGTGDHEVLWSYDTGNGGMADITPAIDENDNIYFSIVKEDYSAVLTFALNKDGEELWKNETDGTTTDKVTYADGKIFVVTENPVTILCLQASNGNVLWSNNLTENYDFEWNPKIAINNNKIYLFSGQFLYGFLMAYDFKGNEIWMKQGPELVGSLNLSVKGNALYFHDGNTLYRYDDNGSSCDSTWAYTFINPKNSNNERGLVELYSIPIDDDGNIYIRQESIWIISPEGQLIKEIPLDASFDNSYSNITLTSNNDILIGNGNLINLSSNGDKNWETSINDGMIINPSFNTAPTISSDGNYYDAQLFGLYSVKSSGALNWKENAETGAGTEYGNLHPPVLTHEGNIISVSSEQSVVRCFKGDGKGLATGGWPKVYGDYANTSSK